MASAVSDSDLPDAGRTVLYQTSIVHHPVSPSIDIGLVAVGSYSCAGPKLVCIDLQPYTTTQAPDRSDILNVGGFSDAVFSVVAAFLGDDNGRFVAEVEKVEL